MTKLLTRDEVCEQLSISQSTLYRIVSTRELRAVKIGGQYRFEPQEIERYIASCRTPLQMPVTRTKAATVAPSLPTNGSGYYPGMKVV